MECKPAADYANGSRAKALTVQAIVLRMRKWLSAVITVDFGGNVKNCGNCQEYVSTNARGRYGRCCGGLTVPKSYVCNRWKPKMETCAGVTETVMESNYTVIPNSSPKDLQGKIRLSLVTPEFIEGVALCRMGGIERYGEDSWKDVPADQWLDAMYRHVLELVKGNEINDKDWGYHHCMHIGANAMLYLMAKQLEADRGEG